MSGDGRHIGDWPGTYWEPRTEDGGPPRCGHCGRDYAYHGAGEVMARKLGLRVNQQHLICRPDNDINPDRPYTRPGLTEIVSFKREC